PAPGNLPVPEYIQEIMFPPQSLPGPAPQRPREGGSVRVWCRQYKMHIRVRKNLFGFRCGAEELTLGSGCKSNAASRHYIVFNYGLHECGNTPSIVKGQLVYSNVLRYVPSVAEGQVRRSFPFTVPIQCHYNRYQRAYKVGYHPVWPRRSYFRHLQNNHSFVLTTTDARWDRLSSRITYLLGQPVYFQAVAPFIAEGQRLFIHSCYATNSPDQQAEPRFTVIDNLGCMVDSKLSGCRSRFLPSKRKDVLRFSVDAFTFDRKADKKTELYMHCTMAVANEGATPGTKSCTYNRRKQRWEELYGDHDVCRCCDAVCSGGRGTDDNRTITSKMVPIEAVKTSATPLYREHLSWLTGEEQDRWEEEASDQWEAVDP
uniref:Zona pellucida sperm-binding protein 3 n=1 Tax=Lepisosteus oculatus TaxID=7918 RepID=W5M247_LEPOC